MTMPTKPGSGGTSERRRERRHEVDLPGTIHHGTDAWPVRVSDLSAAGALITAGSETVLASGLTSGTRLALGLAELGSIDAMVAHAGSDFYGLQFLHPHLFRDRLSAWLRKQAPRE